MNDTVKNDQQENTEVTQERNRDQEESSLIDSLFFSGGRGVTSVFFIQP